MVHFISIPAILNWRGRFNARGQAMLAELKLVLHRIENMAMKSQASNHKNR